MSVRARRGIFRQPDDTHVAPSNSFTSSAGSSSSFFKELAIATGEFTSRLPTMFQPEHQKVPILAATLGVA